MRTRQKWWRTAALLAVTTLLACSRTGLADMTVQLEDDYAAICWEDRTYIPYAPFDRAACGEQIGIVDGDESDRVYAWTGHDPKEWIINGRSHDGVMLLREHRVNTAPDGIPSEYSWNSGMQSAP